VGGLDERLALALVERGGRLAPLDRAVLMAATFAGLSACEAEDLALDRRDRVLIEARMAAFGPSIDFFARCPHCGGGCEATFDLRALPTAVSEAAVQASIDGVPIQLRAPSSRAVAEATLADDPVILLGHCVDRACVALDAVEAALCEAFPLLDLRFNLACAACEGAIATRFDIGQWLWREVEALARLAIDAVDRLARAYGWSEAEILALSPARRSMYLARVAG
jgi:hypothetical protein